MTTRQLSTSWKRPRVVIVGAGVIGLTVGVCLTSASKSSTVIGKILMKTCQIKDFHDLDVTIVAKDTSPFTTSDKAGGLIVPYEIGVADAGAGKVKQWTTNTFTYFRELCGCAGVPSEEIGVNLFNVVCDIDSPCSEPWYKDLLYDWQVVPHPERELSRWMYKSYIVEGKRYLPWLMKQFCSGGGIIKKGTISNLSELRDYDIIINCTGLGSKQLVNDPLVYPIRGQIVAVKPKQEIETVYERYGESSPLIIPHHDYVILGGTDERNHWSEEPDSKTTTRLYDMCVDVMPALRGAQILESWVGLRPARERVRLEVDENMSKTLATGSGHYPHVVHCYGHGGQGYVLHWGCALEVLSMVHRILQLH